MSSCDRCGKESGKLYCGRCRAIIQKERGALIPVLYWTPVPFPASDLMQFVESLRITGDDEP
jgi:hypothetical protein